MGLGEEVAAQRAPGGVEPLRVVPQPQEHLLHHLLGQGLVGQQAPGQPEDGAGVAAVGLGQRLLAVAPDGDHERRIGDVANARAHRSYDATSGWSASAGSRPAQDGSHARPTVTLHHLDVRGLREQVDERRLDVAVAVAVQAARRRGPARPDRS